MEVFEQLFLDNFTPLKCDEIPPSTLGNVD